MNLETAVFGGGCFWCTEAIFTRLIGVKSVESGYTGGQIPHPTYEQVCRGNTNHVEAIQIKYDPNEIAYSDLLNVFFAMHDPTTLNRQGNDVGTQYRSAIFYVNDDQKQTAGKFIQTLESDKIFAAPIVTGVIKLEQFWPAESYHQRYYEANVTQPYCQVVIDPKIAKLRQKFAKLLKGSVDENLESATPAGRSYKE